MIVLRDFGVAVDYLIRVLDVAVQRGARDLILGYQSKLSHLLVMVAY
jgi:hypothetical protein